MKFICPAPHAPLAPRPTIARRTLRVESRRLPAKRKRLGAAKGFQGFKPVQWVGRDWWYYEQGVIVTHPLTAAKIEKQRKERESA